MHDLKIQDREAVLLRYFQGQDFRSVGIALGLSEAAAQMRVSRALETLRRVLVRRGIVISPTALAVTLGTNAVVSAPAGLATFAAGSALAGAAVGSGTTVTLMKLIAMTKIQAGIASAVVAAGLTTSLVVQHRSLSSLQRENDDLREQSKQLDQVKFENEGLRKLKLDTDEFDRLKANHTEVIRLRGEARS
jgi:hypothetical protein